ncbi:MAG: ABC transporter ATP-binding protein [Clostridia bacterium]|nr:ABC transporter ATP-binding protein [Clostridia bacterium]
MIEVKHLTKKYGDHKAVSDLNFRIENGEIYGFLGPNGAGKTTTMNMMTGCLSATEGSVTIDGMDIFEDATKAKKKIGYLPELPPLYQDMTPEEYLRFVARAKGVKGPDVEKQIDHAMKVTGTHGVKNRLIRNLSKGYKQRVGIAQALLGDPEIIILDEPTVGLDPKQIIEIRELIKELGKDHTVILSSHILSEVQEVCSRIMIISKGRLVANDTPDNLEKRMRGDFRLELVARATKGEAEEILASLEGIRELEITPRGGTVEIGLTTEDNLDITEGVFFAFAEAKKPILEMRPIRSSLEDIFLELTGNKEEVAFRRDSHRVGGKEEA